MRQVYEKRYTPDFVRAFELEESRYVLIAPSDWFLGADFANVRANLWDDHKVTTEHIFGFSEDEQLSIFRDRIGEEVIL